MQSIQELLVLLKQMGFRITAPKRELLEIFIANQDRMLSVSDVFHLLPENSGIDNATVYRNIQKFSEQGILESMIDDRGINRYTLQEKEHHHYLICTQCGRIIRFPCATHYWNAFAKEANFLETMHKLEVYGICASCNKSAFDKS